VVAIKEARTSFLKKRSKKLLDVKPSGTTGARARVQEFFGSFFQKRTSSSLPIMVGD
jgi:hypothetical protein